MTANEFLELVRRSQLVEEDQLTKFLGGLAAHDAQKLPDPAQAIAGAMIAQNLLTEWQAEKLVGGKFKGFILDGKYELLQHFRRECDGQVYLAEETLRNRKVAIKVFPRTQIPNVPCEKDPYGTQYLVMEYRGP